ncbi:MAG: 2-amino-4-hydroxy-6-hydroxymethyldihydropteridine diphosphokinase [Candidatus Krumholzibacteria bacterium]|nr:2-amino-4-hydroxy-6-hydroxymethyldihydropteridine diphosphokinase [Candidatus Krumholzibacteria bacterium]
MKQDKSSSTVYLSLGSNEGAREERVLAAAGILSVHERIDFLELSPLYETEPEGDGFSRPFINAVAMLKTDIGPYRLLDICQEIEKQLGRVRQPSACDRAIDIDIVFYGDLVINDIRLTLPHPRAVGRMFVLKPMRDIDPGVSFPPDGVSVSELIGRSVGCGWVRMVSSRGILPSNFLSGKDLD